MKQNATKETIGEDAENGVDLESNLKITEVRDYKTLFEQHWAHVRYLGQERSQFTSIYLVFVITGLAFGLGKESRMLQFCTLLILISVSCIGFLIMARISISLWLHFSAIKKIAPILCPGETNDYETEIDAIKATVVDEEKYFGKANNLLIRLSAFKGIPVPTTLLFPGIFFVISIFLVLLFVRALFFCKI